VAQSKIYIYGKHALREALTNAPQVVRHVYFAREMDDKKLRDLVKRAGLPIEPLDERKVTSWVERNAPHQGAVALISLSGLVTPYEEWASRNIPAKKSSGSTAAAEVSGSGARLFSRNNSALALVLLNEVQDPHNVGTIIRSAAAFGASAVLLPQAKQASVNGTVIKASAGMAFSMPLVSVGNIQQTISDLKRRGFRVYGLAGEGKHSIVDEPFDSPALFILGNESQGLPKSTAALCDKLLSIPIEAAAESLNVAAAAAVTLYAWHTKHRSNF
jgi:23S rRNA (guanosine2251-2'-O)-methyltransferase